MYACTDLAIVEDAHTHRCTQIYMHIYTYTDTFLRMHTCIYMYVQTLPSLKTAE